MLRARHGGAVARGSGKEQLGGPERRPGHQNLGAHKPLEASPLSAAAAGQLSRQEDPFPTAAAPPPSTCGRKSISRVESAAPGRLLAVTPTAPRSFLDEVGGPMCSTRALAVGGHRPRGPGCELHLRPVQVVAPGNEGPRGRLPFRQQLGPLLGGSQHAVGGRWYSVSKPAGVLHMDGFANQAGLPPDHSDVDAILR